MKILFLGDSLTIGVPGVAYVPMIKSNMIESDIVNRGIGGDTVSSLYTRLLKMDDLESFNHIVVFVGVNDIFGKMTKTFKVLKTLKKQKWAEDSSKFKEQYKELVKYILKKNRKLVIISPLLIGENLKNKWNIELRELSSVILDISNKNKLPYLDVYTCFKEYLSDKEISGYLPQKIVSLYHDSINLVTPKLVDQKSNKRGLHLTLDGVHLNTVGATILSEKITEYFKKI